MYLHLGDDYSVSFSRIIAILDMSMYENAAENPFSKEAQLYSKQMGKKPSSVVLTHEKAYFSIISVQSLKKRIEETFTMKPQEVKPKGRRLIG